MRKMMILLCVEVFLSAPAVVRAEIDPKEVVSDGFYDPSPLPAGLAESAIKNLQEDSPLPKLSKEELASSIDLRARIQAEVETTLRFAGVTPKSKGEEVTAEVTVRLEKEGIVVRSSRPPTPDLRGGVKVRPSPDEAKRIVVSGTDGTSFAITIPPQDYDKGGYGAVILCPRDRFERKFGDPTYAEEKQYDLRDSMLRVRDASFRLVGGVATLYSSGRSMVYANAIVEVTRLLPPSKPFVDSIYSQDPEVDVSYYPGVVAERSGFPSLPLVGGSLTGGIKGSFLIVRSKEKRQSQYLENTVFVQEHATASEIPKVLYWGSFFKASPGYCVMVIQRRSGTFREIEPVED